MECSYSLKNNFFDIYYHVNELNPFKSLLWQTFVFLSVCWTVVQTNSERTPMSFLLLLQSSIVKTYELVYSL